jgi:hypothetical protein
VAARNNVTTADMQQLQTMNSLMLEVLKLVRHSWDLHTQLPVETLDREVDEFQEDRNRFAGQLRRALIQGRNRNARGGPLAGQPQLASTLVNDVSLGDIDERYRLAGTRDRVFDGMEDLVVCVRDAQLALERVKELKRTVESMYEPTRPLTLRERWRRARIAWKTGHCP